jgi:hypothetical protein
MEKKLFIGIAIILLLFGVICVANAAIVEGFEESETIFYYYSSNPSFDLNNSQYSHSGDYSIKVNPSGCGANCYSYYVNLTHTFNDPTMVEGVGLWAREGSTSGSAWGGKIRVGHDSEWDLDWWGVVNNGDRITGDWQYIYVPIDEIVSSITINVFDITSRSSMWLDDIQIDAVPVPAAVWLLGSGLLCLMGVRKRMKR